MDAWHIWVIIALLLFILEIFTPGFAVACLAIGSLASAAVAAFDLGLNTQLLVFAIISILSLISVRPLVLKLFYKQEKTVATNTDALIGRRAIVTEKIVPITGGRVKIDGDDWKAMTEDGSSVEIGQSVRIIRIDSVVLTVKAE